MMMNYPFVGDLEAMIAVEDALVAERGTGSIWIYKPACNNRGRGIQVQKYKCTVRYTPLVVHLIDGILRLLFCLGISRERVVARNLLWRRYW